MPKSAAVLLVLILATACAGPVRPGTTPAGTIDAVSQSVRDRDFYAFYDLHTEEAFAEERAQWERDREGWLGDPGKVDEMARVLGVSSEGIRRMTFRDGFELMMRKQVEADPSWVSHVEDLTLVDEQVDGEQATIRVRYGKPKDDEEHDLVLVSREGAWLIQSWD